LLSLPLPDDEAAQTMLATSLLVRCARGNPDQIPESPSVAAQMLDKFIERAAALFFAEPDDQGQRMSQLASLIGLGGNPLRIGTLGRVFAEESSRVIKQIADRRVGLTAHDAQLFEAADRIVDTQQRVAFFLGLLKDDIFELTAAHRLANIVGRRLIGSETGFGRAPWADVGRALHDFLPRELSDSAMTVAGALSARIRAASNPRRAAKLAIALARVTGHLRLDLLSAVEVTSDSVEDINHSMQLLLRSGITPPYSLAEKALRVWLNPATVRSTSNDLKWIVAAELLTAMIVSDQPTIAAERFREIYHQMPTHQAEELWEPLAISGLPNRVDLLLEAMVSPDRDIRWYRWCSSIALLPPDDRACLVRRLFESPASEL
jgi:hypothetical protein